MARIGGFGGANNSQVILNVYDLSENNAILYPWGLGMYHSGVQIGREEYTFAAQAGIFTHEPKGAPGAKFRESINLGVFKGTTKDIETIISSLRPQFRGQDYHVLNKNCNAFANEFVQRLVGKEVPGYVNRMAYYGSFFSCLLPDQTANNAPVDASSGGGSSSSFGASSSGGYSRIPTASSNPVPSTTFNAPGKKLGGGSTNESVPSNERRQRLLNAAATRSNNNNQL